MSKIILNGILGNNCGKVSLYTGTDKRLMEKGITVSNGIPTLRGYAKISDLYAASEAKYIDYQRDIKPDHVEEIQHFLDECKDEAKFLPEVVLSISKPENVKLYKLNHRALNSIAATAKGVVDNLDYFTLEIDGIALSRVDGNHRLEAGKKIDLLVPFSIVLWNLDENNPENLINPELLFNNTESEAFLFYILNNTAKKLELEENYKGLVKSENWTSDELALINRYLPLLQYFYNYYANNPLLDKTWLHAPLSQVGEILTDINDKEMDSDAFGNLLKDAIMLLSQDIIFDYVKSEFKEIAFQLAFYARYQNNSYENTKSILGLINKWLKKYKYTNNTFTSAIKIYDVAYKFITSSPKYVFVAMEYKSEQIVKEYNDCLKRALYALNNMGSNIEIGCYPIMMGEGKSINITTDIYKKIDECAIFVADITEANPNVMYELGIAYNKQKPIILVREKNKKIRVPSDIISDYYYSFSGMYELEDILIKNIKVIMETEYGVVFPG